MRRIHRGVRGGLVARVASCIQTVAVNIINIGSRGNARVPVYIGQVRIVNSRNSDLVPIYSKDTSRKSELWLLTYTLDLCEMGPCGKASYHG